MDEINSLDDDPAEASAACAVIIQDSDFLLRKIEETPHLHPRPEGGRRISKAAFSASSARDDPEQGMSCNSEQLMEQAGIDVATFSPGTPVLARIAVSDLAGLGLTIVHRPLPDDVSHCNVLGVGKTHRKKILSMCTLLRAPPDVHKQ